MGVPSEGVARNNCCFRPDYVVCFVGRYNDCSMFIDVFQYLPVCIYKSSLFMVFFFFSIFPVNGVIVSLIKFGIRHTHYTNVTRISTL